MLIYPNNILSVDFLRPITIENEEYRSVSHYAYSKTICKKNKLIIKNSYARDLKKTFNDSFVDCYRDFYWENIKRALDMKFSIPYFFNALIKTGKHPLYYICYSKNPILGVDEKLKGENKIGKYLMSLRDKIVNQNLELEQNKISQEFIEKLFIIHTEYMMLLKYVQKKQKKIREKNVNKVLIVTYNEQFPELQIKEKLSTYESKVEDFIQNTIYKEIHSVFAKQTPEYKQSILDMYKRNQFSEAEMNEIRVGYKTEIYFDLLNDKALYTSTPNMLKKEKRDLLKEYLKDFFTRHYPNSSFNQMTLDFMANTEEHKIDYLADKLWDQLENRQLPEYLYDSLNNEKKKFNIENTLVNDEKTVRMNLPQEGEVNNAADYLQGLTLNTENKQTSSDQMNELGKVVEKPIPLTLNLLKENILVIRETFDPLDKLNNWVFSLTYPHPFIFSERGYPTLMHYVLTRTGSMFSFEPNENMKQIRKVMLKNKFAQELELSTDIYQFENFSDCDFIAFEFAGNNATIRVYKYCQQGIYERIIRDPEYLTALKMSKGKLQYVDPSNIRLGVGFDANKKIVGKNEIGNFMGNVRNQLRHNHFVSLNIPVLHLLNDEHVKDFLFHKIDTLTEIISIFGEYINIQRHGFVSPLGIITEDSIRYIVGKITSNCLFTNTTYALPALINKRVIDNMKRYTKQDFSKYISLYIWNYLYQLLIVYYFYIYKTMNVKQKNEILLDIDSFGTDESTHNIQTLSNSLNSVKQMLNNYVHDDQQETEYALKIMFGNKMFNQYVDANNKVNNLNQVYNFVSENKSLWKRILFFNSI